MSTSPGRRSAEVVNPFGLGGLWLTGGLHLHTTGSDGSMTPEQALARARDLGYDFLAVTDHERVTIPLTVPEGIVHIPGVEYATFAPGPDRYWHVIAMGTEKCLAMPGYPVNAILKLVAEVAPFYYVAHPYWSTWAGTICCVCLRSMRWKFTTTLPSLAGAGSGGVSLGLPAECRAAGVGSGGGRRAPRGALRCRARGGACSGLHAPVHPGGTFTWGLLQHHRAAVPGRRGHRFQRPGAHVKRPLHRVRREQLLREAF